MYYFVYPTYSIPYDYNWLIPNPQLVTIMQTQEQQYNLKQPIQIVHHQRLLKKTEEEAKQSTEVSQRKRQMKMFRRQKRNYKDEDYHPEIQVAQLSKKSQQLQNRNVVPNIIRLILSFIQKKGKSLKIVQKLFAKSSIQSGWNIKRFYLYQTMVRNKMNNYVNIETLQHLLKTHLQQTQLFCLREQTFYNTITRTIIDHFVRNQIAVCILTSQRMDKKKKTHHLNALRQIRKVLLTVVSSS